MPGPIFHIVLFELRKTSTEGQIAEFAAAARAMVGQVPGLISLEVGPCLPQTLQRSQGFEFGLCAMLEKVEDLPVYAKHDAHLFVLQKIDPIRNPDKFLAFDFESGIKF
ncbi:hypothetical protein T439DRAFT_307627 [Meredithblackwellia eburnea MCA 4105]